MVQIESVFKSRAMAGGGLLHLWNEFTVEIMVLVSFALQLFLLACGGTRRRSSSAVLRIALWLAYLSADSTALYALGHLSVASRSRGHLLVAFWAPFLLLHLGGPDNITAYALEDNRLWLRHLQTLIVQAMGAAYVLYKYIFASGGIHDGKLLMAASICMFAAGLVKYGERVWALKRGNLSSIASSFDKLDDTVWQPSRQLTEGDEEIDDEEILLRAHSHFEICKGAFTDVTMKPWGFINTRGGFSGGSGEVRATPTVGNSLSLPHKFEEEEGGNGRREEKEEEKSSTLLPPYLSKPKMLTVLDSMAEMELSLMYDILYTKAAVIHTWYGFCIHLIPLLSTAAAFMLFQLSIGSTGDGYYSKVDVVISYVLLAGALVLEAMSLCKAALSSWTCSFFLDRSGWKWLLDGITFLRRLVGSASRRLWSGSIRQYNLLDMAVSDKNVTVSWLAKKVGLKDWWDKRCFSDTFSGNKYCSMEDLKVLVLKDPGILLLLLIGADSSRGGSALRAHSCEECVWTVVDMDLDASILMWHIVTDLAIRRPMGDANVSRRLVKATKVLSDYMMFLLVFKPEMLPSHTRRKVHLQVRKELERCWIDCSEALGLPEEAVSRPRADMLADWLLSLRNEDSQHHPSHHIEVNSTIVCT
ncbi:uncharacterized protein LOC120686605 [Panicum virgatum]|uniref:uncharacterized protein LOC120686605 n=1 Tax=Panicum virgatum TaxID=38727 RepID=UPI0019D52F7F|nr:uncharacterized protein LOC120686605 [Panicum virgatum]